MGVRAKDLLRTPAHDARRVQRQGMKEAAAIKAALSGKKFGDLLPAEKDDLLKLISVHFGFVLPDTDPNL